MIYEPKNETVWEKFLKDETVKLTGKKHLICVTNVEWAKKDAEAKFERIFGGPKCCINY